MKKIIDYLKTIMEPEEIILNIAGITFVVILTILGLLFFLNLKDDHMPVLNEPNRPYCEIPGKDHRTPSWEDNDYA